MAREGSAGPYLHTDMQNWGCMAGNQMNELLLDLRMRSTGSGALHVVGHSCPLCFHKCM